jgi:hypothetical protein
MFVSHVSSEVVGSELSKPGANLFSMEVYAMFRYSDFPTM